MLHVTCYMSHGTWHMTQGSRSAKLSVSLMSESHFCRHLQHLDLALLSSPPGGLVTWVAVLVVQLAQSQVWAVVTAQTGLVDTWQWHHSGQHDVSVTLAPWLMTDLPRLIIHLARFNNHLTWPTTNIAQYTPHALRSFSIEHTTETTHVMCQTTHPALLTIHLTWLTT